MNKLKKLKEASLLKRQVILFAVLLVLAVPMVILVRNRFINRVVAFDSEPFFEQFEMDEEIGETFLQIKETQADIQELMEQMPDMSPQESELPTGQATTSTSTDDVNYQ